MDSKTSSNQHYFTPRAAELLEAIDKKRDLLNLSIKRVGNTWTVIDRNKSNEGLTIVTTSVDVNLEHALSAVLAVDV